VKLTRVCNLPRYVELVRLPVLIFADGDNKCNNATTAFDSNQLIRLNLVPISSFFVRRDAENILQITNAFCSTQASSLVSWKWKF